MLAVVRTLSVALVAVAMLSQAVSAATGSAHRLPEDSSATQQLLADARDGMLHEHSLARAALIAGGIDDSGELNRLEDRVNQLASELSSSILFAGDSLHKARVLHGFLHAKVLHHYDARVTDLRRTLDDGVFNCVAGAVLYVAIGRKCGLDIIAEQSRGHARCVLHLKGEDLILETTQTKWTTTTALSTERRLRQTELLAMFFFNRGHVLHEQQRFEEAVAALVMARALDPHCPEVQGNLVAMLSNWALSREAAGDPDGAEQVRAQGRRLVAEHR